jgi:hypothetical protein
MDSTQSDLPRPTTRIALAPTVQALRYFAKDCEDAHCVVCLRHLLHDLAKSSLEAAIELLFDAIADVPGHRRRVDLLIDLAIQTKSHAHAVWDLGGSGNNADFNRLRADSLATIHNAITTLLATAASTPCSTPQNE